MLQNLFFFHRIDDMYLLSFVFQTLTFNNNIVFCRFNELINLLNYLEFESCSGDQRADRARRVAGGDCQVGQREAVDASRLHHTVEHEQPHGQCKCNHSSDL